MTFPMLFFKPSQKLESSSCSKDLGYTIGRMDTKKGTQQKPMETGLKGNQQKAYDPNEKKQENSLIRPITRQNVLYYYIPALGGASYALLSVSVLNPTIRFSSLPKRDLTNVLLATTLFGTGCYIYSRPHIKNSTKNSRYGFSALGSIMFNFSSVLLWAILRSMLPENVAVCSAAGLASSYILIRGATNYIEFVDNKISI